jgi:hypothetical protein
MERGSPPSSTEAQTLPQGVPRDAASQSEDPLIVQEQTLLAEGYELRRQWRDAEALKKYQEAYALKKDAKPLAQMALAEQALGHWATAYRLLGEALADRANPWIAEHRDVLQSEREQISSKLVRLTLVIEPVGAAVRIDGRPIGNAPVREPLLLDPGSIVVEISRDGYETLRREFTFKAGQLRQEDFRLSKLRVPVVNEANGVVADAARTRASPESSTRNPIWLGTAVGGAVVLTAAAIPWTMANQKMEALAETCKTDPECDFAEGRRDIRRLDLLTNLLFFTGAGVTVTSSLLYVLAPSPSRLKSSGLSAWMGPAATGISYQKSF